MPPDDAQPAIGQINAGSALTAGQLNNYGVVNVVSARPLSSPHPQRCIPPHHLPPRIDEFVGRGQDISTIHASLNAPRQPGVTRSYVIHGHGGIGKTALASAYAWHHLADYPGGLFFLDCSVVDVVAKIADFYLPLFGAHDSDPTHVATKAVRVKQRLEDGDSPCLLILDNVHDADHLAQLRNSNFLPLGGCDHLITTNNPHLPNARPLALEPLLLEDGVALLAAYRSDITTPEDNRAAAVIVDWLGRIPFCLSIVGIYMRRNSRVTWQGYAASLQSNGLDAFRGTEATTAGMLPDSYARRLDPIMDTLLSLLGPNERRVLEYMALFPRELAESVLTTFLAADVTVSFPAMPGYSNPVQPVLAALERENLITPRGDAQTRTLAIHELLRRKLMEHLSTDNNLKKHLCKNIYDCSVQSFIAPTDFASIDDPYQAAQQWFRFINDMLMNFQILETHGYIENAGGHYNHWFNLSSILKKAQKLAAELNGRVEMRMELTGTGCQVTPIVVVEEADRSKAEALARVHYGQVKYIVGSPSDVKCIVVINVAA
jgi:hypothetical protein